MSCGRSKDYTILKLLLVIDCLEFVFSLHQTLFVVAVVVVVVVVVVDVVNKSVVPITVHTLPIVGK